MYPITHKITYLLLITIFLISGCGGGGSSTTENTSVSTTSTTSTTSTPVTTTESSNKATQSGQVKDSVTGAGLEGVSVSIGTVTSKTDANGYYTLDNISEADIAVINFKKDGYLLGSTKIEIKPETLSSNYLEYRMHAYSDNVWTNGKSWSYETQTGASGGAVIIPAGGVHTDSKGNIYEGTVTARWYFSDIMTNTETRDTFPGMFKGINSNGVSVSFVSYALIAVELTDADNNPLDLSETITLELPALTGSTQDSVPLWYYDYEQGLWIEDGSAQKQSDGTYIAEISHSGTWSISQALEEEHGIYRGYIIDANGEPMRNVRLKAIGDNWISKDLSTDEYGLFEIEVIPERSFQLAAYDYNAKFGATYPNVIPAIAAGEVVED